MLPNVGAKICYLQRRNRGPLSVARHGLTKNSPLTAVQVALSAPLFQRANGGASWVPQDCFLPLGQFRSRVALAPPPGPSHLARRSLETRPHLPRQDRCSTTPSRRVGRSGEFPLTMAVHTTTRHAHRPTHWYDPTWYSICTLSPAWQPASDSTKTPPESLHLLGIPNTSSRSIEPPRPFTVYSPP